MECQACVVLPVAPQHAAHHENSQPTFLLLICIVFALCPKQEALETLEHPHAHFMERAIYLSRVAGLEKRTGECWRRNGRRWLLIR